jgi:hypothetical protein
MKLKDMIIVGGSPDKQKKSKIIDIISEEFIFDFSLDIFNGRICNDISKYDLTLWMIDIDNKEEKIYPKKKKRFYSYLFKSN